MAQISVRVDDAVKHEAEQTFDEIGLSMNTAITIFSRPAPGKSAFRSS